MKSARTSFRESRLYKEQAKDMEKSIEIPEGAQARMEGKELVMSGPKGELRRAFSHHSLTMEARERQVLVRTESNKRKDSALVGTWLSHAGNMAAGVTQGFEARLRIVYSHFPMKLAVEGDRIVVNNFLGERSSRSSRIVGDTRVEVSKDEVIATGISREDVGQTAANLELLTRVKGYDRRVFQDGCHLVQKATTAGEAGEGK
jgi:large subunit ribosomal protein L6